LRIWKKVKKVLPALECEFKLAKAYFRVREF
jgi:hypothetical protein